MNAQNIEHIRETAQGGTGASLGDLLGNRLRPYEVKLQTDNDVDVRLAVEFLRQLDPTGRHHLAYAERAGEGQMVGRVFEPSDWIGVEAWLRAIPPGSNVYFSPNEPAAGAADQFSLPKTAIASVRAVCADVDPWPDRPFDEARRSLTRCADEAARWDHAPSHIIDSGGGIQLFWLLPNKLDVHEHGAAAEAAARGIAAALIEKGAGKVDAVQSLQHVFRLPGTTNHASPRKLALGRPASAPARVRRQTGQRHHLSDLQLRFPATARDIRSTDPAAVTELMEQLRCEPLEIDEALRTRFEQARTDHWRLDRLWAADPTALAGDDRSGSGWRFNLAQCLAGAGFTDPLDYARLVLEWGNPAVDQSRIDPETPDGLRQLARDWVNGAVPLLEDVRKWFAEPADPLFPPECSASIEHGGTATGPKRFQPISFDEAAEKALVAGNRPLIKGLLDQGAMTVLYGESNTGKTFVAMDIAYHVARGLNWAAMRTTQAAVLYVAAEGGQGARRRAAALKSRHGTAGSSFQFLTHPIDLLRSNADLKPLLAMIADLPEAPGLIVIDTLSRALAGGDENSPTDMGALVKNLDQLRAGTGAHLLVVHHSGKDASKGARGHSLLRAATDTEIEIRDRQISVTKQRDLDGTWSSGFDLDVIELGRDEDGDPITSCVVQLAAVGDAETLPSDNELAAIARCVSAGKWRLAHSGRARGSWVGNPIAEALGIDISTRSATARVIAIVDELLRTRQLVTRSQFNPRTGRDDKFVEPAGALRCWVEETPAAQGADNVVPFPDKLSGGAFE